MLRNLKILFAFALVAYATASYADPPSRVGRLNYASGAVSFAPAEAPDQWTQAVLNRPLVTGDRLWADNDGRAELHVGSTAVRMGPLTSVDVLNLDDQTLQLRLAQGTVNLRVRQLGQGETLEIATPGGAVVIRQPGSYRVSADPRNNVSRAAVNFGQAEVVTPAQTFTVPSSQVAVMQANGSVSFELASYASSDDFDRWSAERDRREDRIASTRYVSPETTGYEDLDQYGAWRSVPDYGAVWYPTVVATGWTPYRYGHWVWISPWGWTWIDDAPWGFAPFHYGRWVYVDGRWGWAPGRVVRRPVYAPALVAFVGGAGWSVSISSGPAVGWFPLGFHDPYIPWYRVSRTYVRNVNVTHVTNMTNVVNIYNNPTNVTNIHYAHRGNPGAVTVIPQSVFVSAKPVARSTMRVAPPQLAQAQVLRAAPSAQPLRTSIVPERPGHRPPASAVNREVVAITAPPKPAAQASFAPGAPALRGAGQESRVRVIGRERAALRTGDKGAPQASAPAPAPPVQSKGTPPPSSPSPAVRGETAKAAPGAVARPPQTGTVQSPAAAPPRTAAPVERAAVPKGPPPAAPDNRAGDEARARAAAAKREPRTAATPGPAVAPPAEHRRPPQPEQPRPPRRDSGMSSMPQHANAIPVHPPQRAEAAIAPREMPHPGPAPLPRAEPPRPRPPMQAEAPRVQPAPPRHEAPPQNAKAPQRHKEGPPSQ